MASIFVAQVLLALAMACATFRLLRGPRAQDRVLALDTLYVNAMLLVLTFGMREGSTLYFEAALVIGVLGFVVDRGARQVPDARRGDRMSHAAELPPFVALLTALLVVLGAALALIGSLGLLRLRSFYDRVHAPTLGTTLGTGLVLIASMVLFSALESRPVLHEILIGVFMT